MIDGTADDNKWNFLEMYEGVKLIMRKRLGGEGNRYTGILPLETISV
jgi:hypothetical protein